MTSPVLNHSLVMYRARMTQGVAARAMSVLFTRPVLALHFSTCFCLFRGGTKHQPFPSLPPAFVCLCPLSSRDGGVCVRSLSLAGNESDHPVLLSRDEDESEPAPPAMTTVTGAELSHREAEAFNLEMVDAGPARNRTFLLVPVGLVHGHPERPMVTPRFHCESRSGGYLGKYMQTPSISSGARRSGSSGTRAPRGPRGNAGAVAEGVAAIAGQKRALPAAGGPLPGSMVAGRTKRPSIAPPRISAGTEGSIKQELKEAKKLIKELMNHRSAWPFNQPVDVVKFPNYYQLIEHPIDMGTMKKRLDSNHYADLDQFAADMKRMWTNCYSFNQDPNSDVRTTRCTPPHYVAPHRICVAMRRARVGSHRISRVMSWVGEGAGDRASAWLPACRVFPSVELCLHRVCDRGSHVCEYGPFASSVGHHPPLSRLALPSSARRASRQQVCKMAKELETIADEKIRKIPELLEQSKKEEKKEKETDQMKSMKQQCVGATTLLCTLLPLRRPCHLPLLVPPSTNRRDCFRPRPCLPSARIWLKHAHRYVSTSSP